MATIKPGEKLSTSKPSIQFVCNSVLNKQVTPCKFVASKLFENEKMGRK